MGTQELGERQRRRLYLSDGAPVVGMVISGVFILMITGRTGYHLTVDVDTLAPGKVRNGALTAQDEPVLTIVLAGLASAMFLWGFVHAFRKVGRYLDIEPEGLRYIHKLRSTLIPWHDVAGVEYMLAKPNLAARFALRPPNKSYHLDVRLRNASKPEYERLVRKLGVGDDAGTWLRFHRFHREAVTRIAESVGHHAPHAWLGEGANGYGRGVGA